MMKYRSLFLAIFVLTFLFNSACAQSSKIEVDNKVAEQPTPKSLPQSPIVKKTKTDAEDENLKGKVKSVSEESEEPTGSSRESLMESYYDENGSLLKTILFNNGQPTDITIYGFIDGARVSDTEFIADKSNERPTSVVEAAPSSNSKSQYDSRYSNKYKYRYDANNRLAEKWMYQSDGSLWMHYVYKFKANQRETLAYSNDGKLNWRSIEILDKNGNVAEDKNFGNDGEITSADAYTYEYDNQGNWIKQLSFEKSNGKDSSKPSSVVYRTITYYQ